ncbi:hypothetical protein PAXINDRAFT_157826 [Paxillus involutus ATCC 200175]|uniref:Unplaced genomic scaffold PAXINscaffold_117, whole genome shotgun sequence n=1 Tax=Paxillus involutus ATCC 200175 TaxID=664439 RepID=A0A0C9SQN1_PAXIN|nr:hypothetical protein PAXINDRAFT_157826 [Paxillus involutus ATCC 200175]
MKLKSTQANAAYPARYLPYRRYPKSYSYPCLTRVPLQRSHAAIFDRNASLMTDYSAPKPLLLATDPSDPGSPMQSVRSPSVDSEDFVQGYLAPVHKTAPHLTRDNGHVCYLMDDVRRTVRQASSVKRRLMWMHISLITWVWLLVVSGQGKTIRQISRLPRPFLQVSCELEFAGSPKLPGAVLWAWSDSVDNVLAPLSVPTSLLPSPRIAGSKYAIPGEWKEFTPPL